jgi:hypothetical protein
MDSISFTLLSDGPSELEILPDPKAVLTEILKQASGLRGRQLKTFDTRQAAYRIADFCRDFSPLAALPAFKQFLFEITQIFKEIPYLLSGGLCFRRRGVRE